MLSGTAGENLHPQSGPRGLGCLPDRYDDGGFTGGNMDRPALQRLMADIESGKVECVVVYKVDRLEPIAARLRPDDGDVRAAQRVVRLGDAALQHVHVDGAADVEHAAVVRPVRAGDDLRADAGQDRGRPAEGEMDRRDADAGL